MFAGACSIDSFEERQAALDEAEVEAETTIDGDTAITSAGDDEAQDDIRGPVLTEDTTVGGDADPTWGDFFLDSVVIAQYEAPISLKSRSGSADLWVAQRNGIIRRIERTFNRNDVEQLNPNTSTVLDISGLVSLSGEQGLLDIEFSLDGRLLYVSYTDLEGTLVVDEYDIGRGNRANADTRREIIRIAQPANNHNGGSLAIGADGFLYLGVGDGGGSGDPQDNGQNTDTLLGTLVRIDPVATETTAYLVPDGNPFREDGGAPEIFLYGVRNPWRFSFDPATGDLWIADVGQNQFEEINHFTAADSFGNGANLGWNDLEAFEPYEGGTPPNPTAYPIFAYSHEEGRCSVTGGHVYRGELMPLLDGVYVFGDYCTGELFGLTPGPDLLVRTLSVQAPREELVSIGTGPDGELYLVLAGGEIRRIQPGIAPAEE